MRLDDEMKLAVMKEVRDSALRQMQLLEEIRLGELLFDPPAIRRKSFAVHPAGSRLPPVRCR